MTNQTLMMRIGNAFIKMILRSPMHEKFSQNFLLISVTGRKSGKTYTTPVNYHRMGNTIMVISIRERTWWRNLRGGAPVNLLLQGENIQGEGKVIEDDQGVAEALAAILQQTPDYAKYLDVTLDPDGPPAMDELNKAAKSKVIVEITLSPN